MRTAGAGPGGFEKRDGSMTVGQDIIMAGYTGYAGTRIAAKTGEARLSGRFLPDFLQELSRPEGYDVKAWLETALAKKHCPVTSYEYAGEGGILAALWNLSGIFNAGIEVDLRLFPIRQVTVEVCELFELNPYRLYCQNCAVFTAFGGSMLVKELRAQGIPAAMIGSVVSGDTRHISHGAESAGFLERPQPDEIYKIDPEAVFDESRVPDLIEG
jgi:hydrogenase expression/formation protein HypE